MHTKERNLASDSKSNGEEMKLLSGRMLDRVILTTTEIYTAQTTLKFTGPVTFWQGCNTRAEADTIGRARLCHNVLTHAGYVAKNKKVKSYLSLFKPCFPRKWDLSVIVVSCHCAHSLLSCWKLGTRSLVEDLLLPAAMHEVYAER